MFYLVKYINTLTEREQIDFCFSDGEMIALGCT